MTGDRSILVLGDHSTTLSGLAERCRRLGFRTVRARTADDAIALSEDRGFRFPVALVQSERPESRLREALERVRQRCRSPRMTAIATGEVPIEEDRARLRGAGVQLALWEPVDDHALRFQLNRALAPDRVDLLRGEERAPAGWRVRVFTQGREKAAEVYSVSCDGAFLATRRPCQKGLEIAIEIALPDRPITMGAEVVYTNVPGNLRRVRLPDGMAVRFVELQGEDSGRLRRSVLDEAARFRV